VTKGIMEYLDLFKETKDGTRFKVRLGLSGDYRKFIFWYSERVRTLINLIWKNYKFVWEEHQEETKLLEENDGSRNRCGERRG
jgi:hypothetical protein